MAAGTAGEAVVEHQAPGQEGAAAAPCYCKQHCATPAPHMGHGERHQDENNPPASPN